MNPSSPTYDAREYRIHWNASDGTEGHGTGTFSHTVAASYVSDLNANPDSTKINGVTFRYRIELDEPSIPY